MMRPPRIVVSARVRLSFLFGVLWVLAFVLKPYDLDRRTLWISDEALHVHLAKQMSVDLADYNPQKANLFLEAQGKPQHGYMRAVLYKHPPLYAFLLSIPFRWGIRSNWSNHVAFWLASLAPLLVYFWVRSFFDGRVAFVAGCLMLIEPIFWIASLRIIMDPFLAILMNLALFAYARSRDDGRYARLFGVALGLALLTKYPAVLVAGIVLIHAALERPSALRRPGLYLGFLIAAAMFVPWIVWNIRVYGNFWKITAYFHGYGALTGRLFDLLARPAAVASLAVAGLGVLWLAGRGVFFRANERGMRGRWSGWLLGGAVVVCLLAVRDLRWATRDALSLFQLPAVELHHRFAGPRLFFLIQMLRMSPFYILAFLAAGFWRSGRELDRILLIAAAVVLGFYLNWRDLESRYILPAVIPLMILAARVVVHVWDEISRRWSRGWERAAARAAWIGVVSFFVLKTLIVDVRIAMAIAGPSFFFY